MSNHYRNERERQENEIALAIEEATAKYDKWINPSEAHELEVKIEKLESENELLKEALEKLRDWAEAYPVEAFPEPDFEGVKAALLLHGFSLGEVSASSYRYLLSRIKDVVEKALKGGEK